MYNQGGGKSKARRPTRRTPMDTSWKAGLEDVIAARSAVCAIDGAAGRLFYRGYEIGELAGVVPFEEVTALLWSGERPDAARAADFRARLEAARGLPAPIEAMLRGLPRDCHPLDALRTAISLDAALDPDAADSGLEANLRKSFRLMARVPEVVAAWHRIRTGRAPVTAPPGGSHAAYVLRLLEGREPSEEGARGTLSKTERANPRARVPGFGHRVYRVDDARARVLRGMAKTMAEATGRERLFEVAERVYDAMKARTDLPVNVDFFSAVVYDALGIPADLCTSIFAIGRVAGWCAHAMEQYADNRLIRPRADYVGVAPRRLAREG